MARKRPTASQPSPFKKAARIMTFLLCFVVGGLLLLGLGEASSIEGVRGALGARQAAIGLIAGHWQSDSGAICSDGLQEVEITLEVTRQVAHILRQQGYDVQVLPEYSDRLNGFQAEVFLAIHADSCINMSGFKLARMTHSDNPELEDRLVETLYRTYAEATGLRPHHDTITEDMRQYHALRRISRDTPGAIIEIGFMGGDRYLLTEEQDRVAVGIANGLMAFLREQATPAPPAE